MTLLPRISIITPSFNQAAFIERTIQSVIGQDYPNIEYIVIDGGSTDGSVDIIRKFQSDIAYWVTEKDRGQAHAINKGLERATGDIIAYLNSDDYYLEGTLRRVADHFGRYPDVDLVHGRCRVVDEHGEKIGEQVGSITRYDEILDLWDVWWGKRNFVQPEVFWTRRITKKIGSFREDLFWVMDYDYWLRILRAGGRVGFVDAELAAFRVQPNQKSTQPARTSDELLQVVQPYIFRMDRSLSWTKRIELKGKWIFDAKFRKEVEQSLRAKENCLMRWFRLAWVAVQHPSIFAAHHFRERLLHSLLFRKAS
jgi:glycosyltransferase involved in cell wall biosynthesis